MNQNPEPQYYTRLAPFRDWMRRGTAALMYHKLGPHPKGTRIRGLYSGTRLFERQLAELARAGFGTVALSDARRQADEPAVVITFDDGFENVLRHGSELLRRHGFKAIEFIIADLIGRTNEWEEREGETTARLMDKAQIRDWLAQGHEIGAHSLKHPFLTRMSLLAAREEVAGSKQKLEDTFGVPIRHFCYPYGDYNQAVRDLVQEAGFETACTTEFGINSTQTDAFALKRLTVRRPSRGVKAWKWRIGSWWRGKVGKRMAEIQTCGNVSQTGESN